MPKLVPICAPICIALVALAAPGDDPHAQPGTQPGEHALRLGDLRQCALCHGGTGNGEADPVFSWQGGMMAQAARDPVFRAALAVANQDVPGIGTWCFRCHAPRGWLAGRATPADGSALTAGDLNGIDCDLCHRIVDPLSDEARAMAERVPADRGNAQLVIDPEPRNTRGPWGDGTGTMPHRTIRSDHHASSELCANCHTVSNPLLADDLVRQPVHAYGHLDRTYDEWLLSEFATLGKEGTCQACHYPAVEGGGQASRFGNRHRDHFVMHGPVGGATWVREATYLAWRGSGMDRRALDAATERARALLRTAASLDVRFEGSDRAIARITNLSGHKLPTGYAEGRRMWLNVRFLDGAGAVLHEVGRFGERADEIDGKPIAAPTLLDPERTRVYECKPGVSKGAALTHGLEPGPSFHLVLNDVILKDNRIPPKGFRNAAFAERLCQPVGYAYADGQHWDDVELSLPSGTRRIEARLLYQAVSWEYVKFLVTSNRTDEWGRRLLDAWARTGRGAPETIAEVATERP